MNVLKWKGNLIADLGTFFVRVLDMDKGEVINYAICPTLYVSRAR